MNKNMTALPIAGFSLAACVTINIYFPAAATEKAADKIIDEVWQVPQSEQKKMEPPKGSDAQPAVNNVQKEPK